MSLPLIADVVPSPEAPVLPPLPPAALWQITEADPAAVDALARALEVSPLVARLLVNRGITDPEEARIFLDPRLSDLHDPHCLIDVDKAVDRLARALEAKETIFIHGDYDADGVTSAALCLRALSGLGANVTGYVPRRSDGYDLQKVGVDRAKALGATLIMTADCGIGAIESVEYAKSLGIDVIVTDHHRPGPHLPDAVAVVNPYREDCDPPPFRELCGAGVAFKVLDALVARIAPPAHRTAFRNNFLDLVALGTVADVTTLRGENRIFVAHGLRVLSEAKKTGIRALLVSLDLQGKTLDAGNISWRLGPRLNAAGRMGDADLAYRLLITRDYDEAEQIAVQMGALAERSREETARVTTEAMVEALLPEHQGRRVLVLARPKWGKGVIGIAAARIVEQCRRPVVLLSYDSDNDHWHGSARSWGDFNLHEAFHQCADLLGRFGGHSASAGVSLPAANLEAFRDKLHTLAEGVITDEPGVPTLAVDAEVDNGSVWTYSLVDQIMRLAPFGRDNAEPTFVTRGALVLEARRMGREGSTFGMSVRLPGSSIPMKAVWFRNGEWADRLRMGDEVDMAYTPCINEWRGKASVELMLKDLRPAS